MVAAGGAGDTAQGNLGGYLAGGQEEATGREGHAVVSGGGDSRGRQAGVWRCWDGDGRRPGGRRTPCGG